MLKNNKLVNSVKGKGNAFKEKLGTTLAVAIIIHGATTGVLFGNNK